MTSDHADKHHYGFELICKHIFNVLIKHSKTWRSSVRNALDAEGSAREPSNIVPFCEFWINIS